MYDELIRDLRENHDKYFARDMQAADAIEELQKCLDCVSVDNDSLCATIDELERDLKRSKEWEAFWEKQAEEAKGKLQQYIEREYVLKCMDDSYKSAGISAEVKRKVTRWLNKAPTADVRSVVLCKDCRHRDPEDHKCDCGQPERQGCMFPVRDKYWCACGEKREE